MTAQLNGHKIIVAGPNQRVLARERERERERERSLNGYVSRAQANVGVAKMSRIAACESMDL